MLLREKLILFGLCLTLYLPGNLSVYAVVPLMIALTATALNSWLISTKGQAAVLAVYVAACLINPLLIYFLPVVCIDLIAEKQALLVTAAILPLVVHRSHFSWSTLIQLGLLFLLSWLLKTQGRSLITTRQQLIGLQDDAREQTLRLEQKTKDLLDKQDYEINLATLKERNRIAREIHDHVGHLLTRAILQLGALRTTCAEEPLLTQLTKVQETLDDSMNEIRSSLHDLHDAAIDLENELRSLVDSFAFCPVRLTYDILMRPDQKTVFAFLAIVREALSNIARHSKATRAEIILREHPGFYQMLIRDNGSSGAGRMADGPIEVDSLIQRDDSGIGLQNMIDRVRGLDGLINFRREQGFMIIVSVPRKQDQQQNSGGSSHTQSAG